MTDIRKSLYICGQQLLSELMSPRVWAAYLLAVVNILRITLSYMDYLGNNPGHRYAKLFCWHFLTEHR